MSEDKRTARAKALAAAKAVGDEYLRACDGDLARLFFTLREYVGARTVFCYWGVGTEPDTSVIIRRSLLDGKRVALPRVIGAGLMEARLIEDLSQLVNGTFGILEPSQYAEKLQPEDIDIAVVPGVAFSADGRRLGRGGGYYDRFLTKVKGLTVALCQERLLTDELPVEEYDIKVRCIITEKKIRRPL